MSDQFMLKFQYIDPEEMGKKAISYLDSLYERAHNRFYNAVNNNYEFHSFLALNAYDQMSLWREKELGNIEWDQIDRIFSDMLEKDYDGCMEDSVGCAYKLYAHIK